MTTELRQDAATFSIPGYEIAELIADSRESRVFRARRTADGLPVILKTTWPEGATDLRHEFEMIRRVDGPGVIRALALERYGHLPVLVLEDLGGESLDRLCRRRRLTLEEVLAIAVQVAEGLAAIHGAGIVHKSINPAHIVYDPVSGTAKLIDFGLAADLHPASPSLPAQHSLQGNLPYLPPEQSGRTNRPVDHRADFYSFGATLYELLLQRPLFPVSEPLEWLHCHIAKQPPAPATVDPGVPAVLSALIMKLLAKSPDERYQSAVGLRADLQRCLDALRATGDIPCFPLAALDRAERIRPPTRLYGRDTELALLLEHAARAARGSSELVLMFGSPGIGKTSLIRELYRPMAASGGRLVMGKFEQLHRNAPYSGFTAALRDLARQLLTEPEAQLAHWKSRLLNTLGRNIRLITAGVPELELIVGPQPEVPALPPLEAEQRFRRALVNVLRACCQPNHPLVMFLDDLQWADSASLRLLETLAREARVPHLLLIGAYRDNEIGGSHPLARALDRLRERGIAAHIALKPLDRQHLTELLGDLLGAEPAELEPLAELVAVKTGGNPFFCFEFIKALQRSGLFVFDHEARRWRWDIERIRAQRMTDNVVDLMMEKLRQLEPPTLALLQLAACIGSRFALATLTEVADLPLPDVQRHLRQAFAEGLISLPGDLGPNDDVLAVFNHDRIHQAAYELLDENERRRAHLLIGRRLLRQLPVEGHDEQLFEVVDHLNLGAELIDDADERRRLSELDLAAGKRAKQAGAYPQALAYLEKGLALLGADAWERAYPLALELHAEAAEAAYLSGRYDAMDRLLADAFARARTLLDRTKLYLVRISANIARGALTEAIAIAKPVLRELGHDYPERPTRVHALLRLAALQWRLRNTPVEALEALPPMTDPRQLAAMSIGERIGGAALFVQPALLPLMILKGVEASLKYGHTDASLTAYASYGMILACKLGQVERGQAFGELALRLTERLPVKSIAGRVLHIHSALVRHWAEPLHACLAPLRQAFELCLDHGDFEYAVLAATVYATNSLDASVPLDQLADDIAGLLATARTLNQGPLVHYLECDLQAALNFLGRSADPSRLAGPVYDLEQRLPDHEAAGDRSLALAARATQIRLSYLFGRADLALPMADAALADIDAHQGMYCNVSELLFDALVRLACVTGVTPRQRRRLLRQAARHQALLKRWAKANPVNFLNKVHLLEAERLRVHGREFDAQHHYDEARRLALEHGFTAEAAIAAELCGLMHWRAGREPVALAYLDDARALYRRWGAQAKVADLERRFPRLKKAADRPADKRAGSALASADFASLIKALKAIADEQALSRMVETIIATAMEFAGAQRGVLILRNTGGQLCVEAEATVDGGEPRILQSQPVADSDLPQTLINFAARTQTGIVVADARQPNGEVPGLELDPYVQTRWPRSLLCLPLTTGTGAQRELIGMLYLENNHASGVFTQERFDVLELIGIAAAGRLELSRKAAIDGLTGLFNHGYFQNLLTQEVAAAHRHKQPLALLLIDIDHFKRVNDTWGHQVGDQVLREVAQQIKNHCRVGDTVARYGGEEMAAILPDTDLADAERIGERIRAAVEAHRCRHGDQEIGVTISLGLAVLDEDTINPAKLIGRADAALYRSKRAGRNRLSVG